VDRRIVLTIEVLKLTTVETDKAMEILRLAIEVLKPVFPAAVVVGDWRAEMVRTEKEADATVEETELTRTPSAEDFAEDVEVESLHSVVTVKFPTAVVMTP
jgi:hypothetical protein